MHRAFQRNLLPLAVALICASGVTTAAISATVTTTADSVAGSLRDAIGNAANGETIDFDGAVVGVITLTAGELVIDKDLTIMGPGAAILTVSGNASSRVLRITNGSTVAISGLTITDGSVVGMDGSDGGDGGDGADGGATGGPGGLGGLGGVGQSVEGGAIWNGGTLALTDCVVSDSSVSAGAGGDGGNGGNGGSGTTTGGNGGNGANGGDGGSADGGLMYNAGALDLVRCQLNGGTATRTFGGLGGNGGHGGIGGDGNGGNAGDGGDGGPARGGCIFSIGSLSLVDTTVRGCSTFGGFAEPGGDGGFGGLAMGVGNGGQGGSAGASGNGGAAEGGAIYSSGSVTIRRSTIEGASCFGGFGSLGGAGGFGGLGASNGGQAADGGRGGEGGRGAGGTIFNLGTGSIVNTTIVGGSASGGFGGLGGFGGIGGQGNAGAGGDGGAGGMAGNGGDGLGGILYNGGTLFVTHATLNGGFVSGGFGGIGGTRGVGGQGDPPGMNGAPGDDGTDGSARGGVVFGAARGTRLSRTILTLGNPGNCGGSLVSDGYNLSDDATCLATLHATGDRHGLDPLLDPLALNTPGLTETEALGVGSPAIDAIPLAACTLTEDQRTSPRPGGAGCEIGAFEIEAPVILPPAQAPALGGLGMLLSIALLSGLGGVAITARRRESGRARLRQVREP